MSYRIPYTELRYVIDVRDMRSRERWLLGFVAADRHSYRRQLSRLVADRGADNVRATVGIIDGYGRWVRSHRIFGAKRALTGGER